MKKELEKSPKPLYTKNGHHAGLAQLVAQLICNHQVGGSNPSAGTIKKHSLAECFFMVSSLCGIYSGLTSLTPAGSPSALPALALRSNPKRALSVLGKQAERLFSAKRGGAGNKTAVLFIPQPAP